MRVVPGCPIIALTANALASNADRARDAGMDDFLTKPAAWTSCAVHCSALVRQQPELWMDFCGTQAWCLSAAGTTVKSPAGDCPDCVGTQQGAVHYTVLQARSSNCSTWAGAGRSVSKTPPISSAASRLSM